MAQKTTATNIKAELLAQLKEKGLEQAYYVDMVNDYMALWVIKSQLIIDIKERGVTVEYRNGQHQYGKKQNDSLLNLVKVNTQMFKILSELGLRGADQEADLDDEL